MKKLCSDGMFDPLSIGTYDLYGTNGILILGKTLMTLHMCSRKGWFLLTLQRIFNAGLHKYLYIKVY